MWFNKIFSKKVLLVLATVLLTGCGGGSGSGSSNGNDASEEQEGNDDTTTSPDFQTVSGTVAVGRAIQNATITAKCRDGSGFRDPVNSGPDGSFSGEIPEEDTPCALRSEGGTPAQTLHSFVTNPIGTTNITPLTDLTIALASGKRPADWFAQSPDRFSNANVDSEVPNLLFELEQAGFQFPVEESDDLTLPDTDLEPFTDPFSIGDTVDQALDELQQAIDNDSNIASYSALVDIVKDGNVAKIPTAPPDTGPIIVTDASAVADPDDAELTITEAVIKADRRSGSDVIRFDPKLAGQTIDTGSIGISSPMTIKGPENNRITLSGTDNNPLITVFNNDEEKSVDISAKIQNLTLTNVGDILAGCIHNREQLQMVNVTVIACEAKQGAGVVNEGGVLTIRDSIITDNRADPRKAGGLLNKTKRLQDEQEPDGSITTFPPLQGMATLVNTKVTENRGSGIVNQDLMTLRQSQVERNKTDGPGGGIFQAIGATGGKLEVINSVIEANIGERGGGISGNGLMILVNSTVSRNRAEPEQTPTPSNDPGRGGGILAQDEVRLYNTSVVDNAASGKVGGVFARGPAEILNSTIAGNNADTGNFFANDPSAGKPIANLRSPARLTTVGNVILSDASGGSNISQSAPAIGGIKGNNVIEGGLPSGPDPKVQPANPGLEPLSDKGGTVPVRMPGSGSVALDLGQQSAIPQDVADLDEDEDAAEAIPFDARGQGFDRVVGGRVDAGAAERNAGSR